MTTRKIKDAEALLTRYLELGVANSSTDGHSEKIIGDFLAKTRTRLPCDEEHAKNDVE